MSLVLRPVKTAMATNLTSPFLGIGGVEPYVYSVLPGGAGGTIDSDGLYTSPSGIGVDTIQVEDDLGDIATATVLVGTPLQLFCDVIQSELGLADGRVYLWDQKINSPSDQGLWVAVAAMNPKPFGWKSFLDEFGNEIQSVNMHTTLSVDFISRDSSARDRKEELILALGSIYSRQQQSLNSFRIFPLSQGFVNISGIDGAAIPYRYNITCNIQYFVTKTKAAEYFDDFSLDTPVVES